MINIVTTSDLEGASGDLLILPVFEDRVWGPGAAAVVETLAEVSPEAIHDDLISMLNDDEQSPAVQVAVARALGKIGGDAAVQALSEVIKSDHRQVRLESLSALVAAHCVQSTKPCGPRILMVASIS